MAGGSDDMSPGPNAPAGRPGRNRSEPMPVKYWSSAGLVLTYWCNARCASCYLCCGPERSDEMTVKTALRLWRQLVEASPHGCRIHITGGEPFGNWPRLLELCRGARDEGLGPLEKIETNAFWASDADTVRRRVEALAEAGMRKLAISADPYHQQYVPIERCRLAAEVAGAILGADRVQVRWRDWLSEGCDTSAMSVPDREALFARWASSGRDRLNGRSAKTLTRQAQLNPPSAFADMSCKAALLRSRHVHVDGAGRVMPGTCAGIVLGFADESGIADLWQSLECQPDRWPVVSTLARGGPVALLAQAEHAGFLPDVGYAGKCHLCWAVRRHLAGRGMFDRALGPKWMYFE